MARTFKLVSGTDEVNLIDIDPDEGIIFARGGTGVNRQTSQLTMTSSQLADGANLRLKRTLPVVESYRLHLKGTSHDNVAAQLQALQRILKKGDQNALTNWQQEPLYIQQQLTNESNPRYAKVLAWNSLQVSDYFDQPIESNSEIDDLIITSARESYWRGTAPGVMPSIEAVKVPDFPWFDEYGGTRANFEVTGAAALSGDWGGAFTVSGAGSEVWGIDNLPSAETTNTIEFQLDVNSLAMTNGDQFVFLGPVSDGVGGFTYRLRIKKTGANWQLALQGVSDGGAGITFNDVSITDGSILVRIEYVSSSGVGNNDGTMELFIAGASVESKTGLDTDTHNVTAVRIGAITELDAGTSGTFYIDRYRWDDALAPTAYERTIDFEQTTAPLPNYRQSTGVISHIFAEDNSATGFSGNLIAEPNWPWFEVSGSTPAVNDAMYFGADEPFYNLVFNLQGGDTDIVWAIEYSDGGSGWSAVDPGAINVFSFGYLETGYNGMVALTFGGDPLWAADTVNAIGSKFWLRIRLTTVTDWTTSPEQVDQVVYQANSPYLELNNLQVHGDVQAQMLQRLIMYSQSASAPSADPEESVITNVIMGMKSRGLDTFVSRLNFGGDNPANWTEALGADTTQDAKETSPGGNVATVDIKNSLAMGLRVKFVLAVAAQDPNDFEGNYRLYARARQNGGANGDVKLRYRYIATVAEFVGETVPMVDTDNDEVIDLGELSMFSFGTLGDESAGVLQFSISLEASSESTGVTDLELYDLVLMPIDEMAIQASWSGKDNQEIQGTIALQMDAGILREGAILNHRPIQASEEFQPFFTWQMKSALPMLEPRRESRLYYLYWGDRRVQGTSISNQGQLLAANTYLHERWNTLRGND